MIRRVCASFAALAVLTACGGGGGSKTGTLPSTKTPPSASKTGTVMFSFKLPSQSTMTKIRRLYQSQATQGVAIDWTSTTPSAPDYAAAISAACPATLPAGIVSCGTDPSDGGTDYTFQLSIPAGTYSHFTVTAFNQAPSGSPLSFSVSASMLAQGQLPAPIVITAGTANTIPNLTFYGIPAAISLVPAPAQSHVVTYSGSTAIIGAMPQTFFVQTTDADGFVIDSSDSGAPAVTVAEAASDSPQHFTIASTSTPYEYTFTAVDASANAGIVLSATPGGSGLAPYQTTVTLAPVQELWTTQEAGSTPNGIYGYPLYPGATPGNPIDGYADPIGNALCGSGSSACDFYNAAIDPASGTVYAAGMNASSIPVIAAFVQGTGSTGLQAPASPVYTASLAGDSYESIAIDAQHHGFVIDNNSGNVSLEAYSTASNGWTPVTSTTSAQNSNLFGANGLAVAPTAPNVPTALAGSIWVADEAGGFLVYPPFSGSLTTTPAHIDTSDYPTVVGFDSAGRLWYTDGEDVYVLSISGTPASPSATLMGSSALVSGGAVGASFGAAAGENMWFGEGGGEETGFDVYTATCGGSSCAIAVSPQELPTNAGSFAAFVTP